MEDVTSATTIELLFVHLAAKTTVPEYPPGATVEPLSAALNDIGPQLMVVPPVFVLLMQDPTPVPAERTAAPPLSLITTVIPELLRLAEGADRLPLQSTEALSSIKSNVTRLVGPVIEKSNVARVNGPR